MESILLSVLNHNLSCTQRVRGQKRYSGICRSIWRCSSLTGCLCADHFTAIKWLVLLAREILTSSSSVGFKDSWFQKRCVTAKLSLYSFSVSIYSKQQVVLDGSPLNRSLISETIRPSNAFNLTPKSSEPFFFCFGFKLLWYPVIIKVHGARRAHTTTRRLPNLFLQDTCKLILKSGRRHNWVLLLTFA